MSELEIEIRDGVLRATINRPARRNAISEAVIDGLIDAMHSIQKDRTIRAMVITGAGDEAFCAGADLQTGTSHRYDYSEPCLKFATMLRTAHALTTPLVARVNGACMAGGIGLLSLCDLAVASDRAIFGLPEAKVGVFPMMVITDLQHLIGKRNLYELCLLGDPIPAAEAKAIGLVNQVVPAADLDERVDSILARLKSNSQVALRRGLYTLKRARSMSFEEAMAFTESQIGLLAMTDDAREGLAAFREKRKPNWTGR